MSKTTDPTPNDSSASDEDDCIERAFREALLRQPNSSEFGEANVVSSMEFEGNAYRPVGVIASGGTSTIFRCIHTASGDTVAIKVLHPVLVGDELLRRFQLEAKLLAKLRHHGIVRIVGYGKCNCAGISLPYIAMEYIRGTSIVTHCRDRALSIRDRLRLLTEVCAAVQYAHQRGVVHRDLKPANILVNEKGAPYILDFGVARIIDASDDHTTMHTRAGQWLGTLMYMSPEQLAGDPDDVDTRSDIYSLGVVAYQVLADQLPYSEVVRNSIELADCIRKVEPIPLGRIVRQCRGDIETVVAKAMAKNREERYSTITEFSADLGRVLASEPILARRTPILGHVYRWMVRQKLVAGLACSLVLTLALLGLLSLYYGARARHAAEQRRVQLYCAEMNLAMQAFEKSDIGSVRQFLQQQVPMQRQTDLRGFEWRYLDRQVNAAKHVILGHTSPVSELAFSPDGKYLASVNNNELVVYDTTNWRPALRKNFDEGPVNAMQFSPQGEKIALAMNCNTFRVIGFPQGNTLFEQQIPDHALSVCFSNDGSMLAGGSGTYNAYVPETSPGKIRVWDCSTFKEIWEISEGVTQPTSMKFLANDHQILAAHVGGAATLWNIGETNGTVVSQAVVDAREVALSSDDSLCAIGSWRGPSTICNVSDSSEVSRIPVDQVSQLAFSPDNRFVLVVSGRTSAARIWDVSESHWHDSLSGHQGILLAGAYSPSAPIVATSGEDRSIRIWDTSKRYSAYVHPVGESEIDALSLDRDERFLAAGDRSGMIRVWDWKTKELLFERKVLNGWGEGAELSPDGETLIYGGRQSANEGFLAAIEWQTDSQPVELYNEEGALASIKYSPCGNYIAGSTVGVAPELYTSEVRVWDARSWKLIWRSVLETQSSQVVAFSPDSTQLASGHDDGVIRIWDVPSGNLVRQSKRQSSAITALAYSTDGKQLGVGTWAHWLEGRPGTEVAILDSATLQTVHSRTGNPGGNYGLCFSPDGSILASGLGSGLVKLWDTKTGMQRAALATPQQGWVFNVRFASDGRQLIATYGSATQPCGIIVWNAQLEE